MAQVKSSPGNENHIKEVVAQDTYDSSWLPILQYCVRFVKAKQADKEKKLFLDLELFALDGFECHLDYYNKKPTAIYLCYIQCKVNSKWDLPKSTVKIVKEVPF